MYIKQTKFYRYLLFENDLSIFLKLFNEFQKRVKYFLDNLYFIS